MASATAQAIADEQARAVAAEQTQAIIDRLMTIEETLQALVAITASVPFDPAPAPVIDRPPDPTRGSR